MKAYLKQIRISPKKVSLVAALVRGKSVTEALRILKFTNKRSAPVIGKLIASAAANAENNFKQDKEKLIISKLVVNGGMTLKRGRPISRGRWHPIKKRTSHITVELSPAAETKKEAQPEKKEQAAKPKAVKKSETKVEAKQKAVEQEKPSQEEKKQVSQAEKSEKADQGTESKTEK